MAWLVAQDRVLATLEIADTFQSRLRGVIGKDELDGVLMLRPARSVHTLGVKFPIDVIYCTADLLIVDAVTMAPNRVGLPRWRSRVVLEAPKGSFERWAIDVGEQLEVRE